MSGRHFLRAVLIAAQSLLMLSAAAHSQDELGGKRASTDQSLMAGFAALSKSNYRDARIFFEAAMASFEKKPEPSQWLFTKIALKDEDPGDADSKDPQIRQITGWRHAMGTRQAVVTFAAFAAQLEGNKPLADKYFQAIYDLQGPMWGTSWRAFVTPLQSLFHLAVPAETSEKYARYLYLSGLLLEDAGEDIALTFFERAQKMSPKDAEIAANLASSYVVRLRAAEAKSLAELSLSIKPKQGRVLIDLATAEWLLGELSNAKRHAAEASLLLPDLPGPHGTLSIIALTEGDIATAVKEAEIGVMLSERHHYYLAILAAAYEASGKKTEADKLIVEAWQRENPTSDQLKKWFFKDKVLELILNVIARQKSPKKS